MRYTVNDLSKIYLICRAPLVGRTLILENLRKGTKFKASI